jgi:hypothetical protein
VKRVLLVFLLVAGAAGAQSGGAAVASQPVESRAGAATYASLRQPVHLVLEPGLCDAADAPAPWRDQSNPWTFASQPLDQLTADDGAFLRLQSLVQLRLTLSSLRLFLIGASAPTWGHLKLVPQSGWQLSHC